MRTTGSCYCGELKFAIEFDESKAFRGQCHCLPCQKIAGGSPNVFMTVPETGFAYTAGQPAQYKRPDLDNAVTREFCGACGTPILTRNPHEAPGLLILKAGALDDPTVYGEPRLAIHVADKQQYHYLPESLPAVPRLPGGQK
ncbi:MAG: GFA family protein [Myxococcota bacterium]